MATKDEITAGIREVEERFDRMLPDILENLDKPLPEGSWTVHDALCHMAADVPSVTRWRRMVDSAINNTPRPPGFNLDEHNQQGIDARKDRPIDEVVQEIRDGLHNDATAVPDVDDALLTIEIRGFSGRVQPASERLKFTTGGHNHIHLDDIEKAIVMAQSSGQ